jgi:hypothetical protein
MSPGWNDRNEMDEIEDEDQLTRDWIEDRYNELIEKHGPEATGGPCHVSLDDENYHCLANDTNMAALAIIRVLYNTCDFSQISMRNQDLYDDCPLEMLVDTYLTMRNIVDIIGVEKLSEL